MHPTGYGGVQMALAHGIPLIVAGDTDDKMEVAARVEWSKTGINLKKQSPTSDEIKDAVREILDNPCAGYLVHPPWFIG